MDITQLPLIQNDSNLITTTSPIPRNYANNEIQDNLAQNPQATLEHTINTIFPSQTEENKIQRARNILGKSASLVTDDEIEIALTQFEFLANCWLDEFERETFEGKTLKESLKLE